MNAPAPAAAPATSHPENPDFAHPARIENGDGSIVARLASGSIDGLDRLIADLKEMRELLRFEGERLQREADNYERLTQTALAVTKAVTDIVSPARAADASGQAQNSTARPLSGGREKLKRWPPPAG